ncbi:MULTISPECIES: RusA family crossover junction endodeoxyribonuclease [Allobaculum]|uniref:RusA family crossover junction endodeoxyribonuclease n=1 Tax=Allobaculum TaxID=174708 RepID=UPI001E53555A|nr:MULTISPECIES: RusA family crossover junction endodeoxyribonuclease [Allobaculum]UNT92629.1 RusA family crossover junction endodeoxyribonuclease [Allobaculum sp. Allo2]
MRISIWLPGQPDRVTHQSGTRYKRTGGTYKTPQLKQWERKLKTALEPNKPKAPIMGPVLLQVTWGFKAPTKKLLFTYKLTRPDTDNMMKTLKDVMSELQFWEDDAQVVIETGKKLWVDEPGIVINLEELGGRCEDWRIEE